MPDVIHKYPLDRSAGRVAVMMPLRRRVLSVQAQHNVPCVWALIDPESPLSLVAFACVLTGAAVPASAGAYVGTVLLDGGAFVLHIFGGS